MKRSVVVAAVVGALSIGPAFAQTTPASRPAKAAADSRTEQPETAPTPTVPTGEIPLGVVHLANGVTANGSALPAGTCQVRLTAQEAVPAARGQTAALERWIEFL